MNKNKHKSNEGLEGCGQRKNKQRGHFKNLSSQNLSSLSNVQVAGVANGEESCVEG